MKWMNKRRWGTKCIKLCTEPNTHIMNYSLPVTSNCISSEVLVYCILYLCVDFVNCFCHRVWSIGGHSVNITFFYKPPDLVVRISYSITSLYTTSFGAGVYSFWFVELWLGYQMFWQELSIGIGFLNTEMCLNNITHPFISSGFYFLWLTQMVLYFTNIDYL